MPVKSKRSTAMSRAVRPSAIRAAAKMSLPQVKQWANRAKARGLAGKSRRSAKLPPVALGKLTFLDSNMAAPPRISNDHDRLQSQAHCAIDDFEFHDLARDDLAARGFIAGRPLDLRRRRLRDHIRHYGSIGNQG